MGLPRHFTSEEAHEAGTESTKGFMRFGTLEEHISKASNVAVQPKYVEDVVFPLRGSIPKGTSLALTAQENGGFAWQQILNSIRDAQAGTLRMWHRHHSHPGMTTCPQFATSLSLYKEAIW